MATQQVKFHSVSTAEYNNVERPINEGSLYFIDDNGEIRKGGKHVTGTRVFKATDTATTGCSAVSDLDIQFEGTSITESEYTMGEKSFPMEKPKRGDMLVVDHEIATGKHEFSAYVYSKNGGEYTPDGWQACDGNVDASKVILTQNFTLAGDYDKVGNIKLSENQFNATGLSVADALTKIFTKELDNSTKTNPSFSLSGSDASVEVGTLYSSQTYTGTWKDGSYGYGAFVSAGNTQTATGAKVGTWTITAYDGKTAADATISGNTASITTDAIRVSEPKAYTLATFNVTNDLSEVKKAATNLKNESASIVISQTTNTAQARKVTGFQYWFYGSFATPKNFTSKDENGNATVEVNNNIRALGKGTSLTSMSVVQDATQVVIAIPASKTLKKVTDGGALNAEITNNFIPTTMKVGGADSSSTSIGSYAKDYKVYVMTPSAALDARTYAITIG